MPEDRSDTFDYHSSVQIPWVLFKYHYINVDTTTTSGWTGVTSEHTTEAQSYTEGSSDGGGGAWGYWISTLSSAIVCHMKKCLSFLPFFFTIQQVRELPLTTTYTLHKTQSLYPYLTWYQFFWPNTIPVICVCAYIEL